MTEFELYSENITYNGEALGKIVINTIQPGLVVIDALIIGKQYTKAHIDWISSSITSHCMNDPEHHQVIFYKSPPTES
jgi:hypothetical protein